MVSESNLFHPIICVNWMFNNLSLCETFPQSSPVQSADAVHRSHTGAAVVRPFPPCIFCSEHNVGNATKVFNQSRWQTLKLAAARRDAMSSDVYAAATAHVLSTDKFEELQYHPKCYQFYTAVKKRLSKVGVDDPPKKRMRRGEDSLYHPPSKGNLIEPVCIFCHKINKKTNGKYDYLHLCNTKDGQDKLLSMIRNGPDTSLHALVSEGADLIAREARYHLTCRSDFQNRIQRNTSKDSTNSSRAVHIDAWKETEKRLRKEILSNQKPMLGSEIFEIYKQSYLDKGGDPERFKSYSHQALQRKVMTVFVGKISCSLYDAVKGNMFYPISSSHADAAAYFRNKFDKMACLTDAALIIREQILSLAKEPKHKITCIEDIKNHAPEVPLPLDHFWHVVHHGEPHKSDGQITPSTDLRVKSIASDAIFSCTSGSVKPLKHTFLGLTVSSVTGSKTLLRALNKMGHSIGYNAVKDLESSFSDASYKRGRSTPDGILVRPDLCLAFAFDNYDVNLDTLNGKDSLHITCGIAYQNRPPPADNYEVPIFNVGSTSTSQDTASDIPPYYKVLKQATFDIRSSEESNGTLIKLSAPIDFFYSLRVQYCKPMPMHQGFNTKFFKDNLPQHKIVYMDPIFEPITNNAAVKRTLEIAVKGAEEVGQQFTIVTYDLAAALKAYAIQALDAPRFDNVLILLGNFHLEMAFYGAMGTFISESGITSILIETEVLAQGSLMGFLKGKFYNRCRRIHELLASALEQKLLERFFATLPEETLATLEDMLDKLPQDADLERKFFSMNSFFKDIHASYDQFFSSVISGDLGSTAAYWATYIYFINNVHRTLMRSVRTNDVDLYIEVLPRVLDIFFGINRPNYARWGVLFMNMLQRAPAECLELLRRGAFSIRRTSADFARSGIDIVLEQTVNRDSASRMKGLVYFHHYHDAILRWYRSSNQRGMAVTELRRMTELEVIEQPHVQLSKHRIQKDNAHFELLGSAIARHCNPFSDDVTSVAGLINLSTGKLAGEDTERYLTSRVESGRKLRTQFEEECKEDPKRFFKAVKRVRVLNFVQENNRRKEKKSCTTSRVTSTQESFVDLLLTAGKNKVIDMTEVVKYPLTEYPLSIAQPDGSLVHTDKSRLAAVLRDKFGDSPNLHEETLPPIAATLIDGGLLLHSCMAVRGKLKSIGDFSRRILTAAMKYKGERIHVLFDKYCANSLKMPERQRRGKDSSEYRISGPEQAPKEPTSVLMKNTSFKNNLAQFLKKRLAK